MRKLFKQNTKMIITNKQIVVKLKTICSIYATIRAFVKISRNFARRRYKKMKQLLIMNI